MSSLEIITIMNRNDAADVQPPRDEGRPEEEDLQTLTSDLVAQAKAGDPEAVNALYRLYEPRLRKVVRKKLGDKLRGRMETMDLVQSVWKDVLLRVEDFEYRGPDSFLHWLLTRIIRKIQDKGRYFAAGKRDLEREQRIPTENVLPGKEAVQNPSPSQAAMDDEQVKRFVRLLDRLPELQRKVVILRMRDEMDFKEIGKKLDRSPDAVRKINSRALKRIAEAMYRDRLAGDGDRSE